MVEEKAFENGRISNFQWLVTLTFTLDRSILHTVVHHSSTSTYMPNFIEIEETFCGRTDGRTDGHLTRALLGQLWRVDLINVHTTTTRANSRSRDWSRVQSLVTVTIRSVCRVNKKSAVAKSMVHWACGFGFGCGLGFLTGAISMGSCLADMVAATSEGLISILSTDKSASIAITLLIARDSSYRHTTHTHTHSYM